MHPPHAHGLELHRLRVIPLMSPLREGAQDDEEALFSHLCSGLTGLRTSDIKNDVLDKNAGFITEMYFWLRLSQKQIHKTIKSSLIADLSRGQAPSSGMRVEGQWSDQSWLTALSKTQQTK